MNRWNMIVLNSMNRRIKRKELMVKTLKLWIREEKKRFNKLLNHEVNENENRSR